ncbi:MAG: SpoIIE family protein phosphatase [Candidatus Solibacter usitatus]|nr:SpoIIE family protein phosphatase [Candidatus Solibacter usitatus]
MFPFTIHRLSFTLMFWAVCAANAQYVDLTGDWRISKDDNPRYAETAFDDSSLGAVKLPWEMERPIGVYWLRKTVPAPPANLDMALVIGSVNESYEVYINGSRIATTPGFGSNSPPFFDPRVFPFATSSANIVIALRIWRPTGLIWMVPFLGEDLGPYAIEPPQAASRSAEAARLRRILLVSGLLPLSLFLLFAACYLIWTFLQAREWPELLWLAVFCASHAATNSIAAFLTGETAPPNRVIATMFNTGIGLVAIAITEFALAALNIRAGRWRWLLWLTLPLAMVLPTTRSPGLPLGIITTVLGIRALREKEMRFTAILLLAYSGVRLNSFLEFGLGVRLFPSNLDFWHFRLATPPLLGAIIATMLMFATLGRLLRDKNEKQRLAGEMQAAREIQQLMLSGAAKQTVEYNVDAVYYPAQEVGGDFYRIVDDGDAKLIVVGDVSGKGLKAAMLVSVIIGALRVVKDRTPAAVLATLSNAVAGQLDGGFVTCCCARLERDGAVRLANAGHLNPYRNGVEVELEGGLPLGILPDAVYEETTFEMVSGEQLTFLSDGVVEAAGRSGELFGFDRTREISKQSAVRIADAAKAWGQNDDITVVTVRRMG